MKTLRSSSIVLSLGAVVALGVMMAHSAPAPTPAPAAKTPAAPAPAADVVPQSVFTIPATPGPARDPFFPNRIIQQQQQQDIVVSSTNSHPSTANCLTLKGLSGAPSSPLAMINGRTMARGEDAEINTTECGKLFVHCVDITTNSAIIEVGGERRELRLRSDF